MVPLDIRCAIADVRSCLGMSTVLWSAILYHGDNMGPDVIVPGNVDQSGMVLEDYIRILVPTTLVDCVHSVGTFAFSCTDLAAAQSHFPPCGCLVFT